MGEQPVHNGNGHDNAPIATARKSPTSAAWTDPRWIDPSHHSAEPTHTPAAVSLADRQKAFRTLRTIVLDVGVIASIFGFALFFIVRPTPTFIAFVLCDLAIVWVLAAAVWRLTR